MSDFTNELWQSIEEIYQRILKLPFNQELMEGTLDKEKFRFYMQQDSLYLADFGKALSLVAARSSDNSQSLDFLKFAEGAIVVERALHQSYFDKFQVQESGEKSPTCFNYTNFLLSTAALRPIEVAIAALLPCFWIYQKVGKYIYSQSQAGNFYQEWIDTYAGEDFAESVQLAIHHTDQAALKTTEAGRLEMKKAFIYSTKLEYMFWDSAYKMERWIE